MKWINRSTVFMLLFFIPIYIFLVVFLTYISKQTLYDLLSNRLYTNNNIILVDSQSADWINEQYDGKYRLYVEIDDYSRVLVQNTSTWIPPMLSGYFPKTGENELKAVVGKNVDENNTININGRKQIECLGRSFEVTGVIGTDYVTSCDNLIILFGLDFKPDDLKGMNIVLDADNQKTVSFIADKIMKDNPSVTANNGVLKGSARLTKNSYFYRLIVIESVFLTAFSLLSFLRYWYEKHKKIRYVYMIHGIMPVRVIMNELSRVVAVNLISLGIVFLLSYMFGFYVLNQLKQILTISILLTLFSCASIAFFFFIDNIKNILGKRKISCFLFKK